MPSTPPMKIVLFCGGSGTRLWPMSRAARPKQFQPLVGSSSLFQLMVRRLARGFGIDNIYISTGSIYRALVLEQTPELPAQNIIAEPEMRDTLACVGYAATVLAHRFPGCTIATLWGADHIIRKDDTFLDALAAARDLAVERDWIVKIDVRPTFPSTALGYIQISHQVAQAGDFEVFSFVRQVEKPDYHTARRFQESFNYLWNTGYIVWNADKILRLYEHHAPDAFTPLQIIGSALGTAAETEVIAAEYARIPRISVDYGVFQKMDNSGIVVIPVDLGWSDIGAWNVLRDEMADDPESNVVQGKHIGIETRRSLIYGPAHKTIVTIGLDDFVVVDMDDTLLICPADRSQDVKKIVERLKIESPDLL